MTSKRFLLASAVLALSSCSQPGLAPVRTPHPSSDRFLARKAPAPAKLSATEAASDLDLLVAAMDRAYVGARVLDPAKVSQTERELKWIAQSESTFTPKELCSRIMGSFELLLDLHLEASVDGKPCRRGPPRDGRVGKNIAHGTPWTLQHRRIGSLNVPILGISRFLSPRAPEWGDFSAMARDLLSAPALILDLRGNPGGDEPDKMKELEALIFGFAPPKPWTARLTLRTPETAALQLNRFEEGPEFHEALASYDKLKANPPDDLSELQISIGNPTLPPGTSFAFDRPIFILADRECRSECETTIQVLKLLPQAVFVGERTAGALEFAKPGLLLLPRSQIAVELASEFHRYPNGAHFEQIGIRPDIGVEGGGNALNAAVQLLGKKLGD